MPTFKSFPEAGSISSRGSRLAEGKDISSSGRFFSSSNSSHRRFHPIDDRIRHLEAQNQLLADALGSLKSENERLIGNYLALVRLLEAAAGRCER